jgi:hypothetical protein
LSGRVTQSRAEDLKLLRSGDLAFHRRRCCHPLAASRDRRLGVDDGRMRASRTNATEGPIDAFDQRNGCSRAETVGTARSAWPRPGTTQGHARQRKVERAMIIEPTRGTAPELENKRFGAMAYAKCDGRVNFRGI